MDTYEATKTVLSRIQSLDPENASKIMGYILIQDQGDKEMIRLAFGPETLLISLINQVKTRLGLSSNTSSAPYPFQQSSPRIMIPNNGFHQPSPPPSPWSCSGGSPSSSLSYAAVVNGSENNVLDQLSFDPVMSSPSGRSDSMVYCDNVLDQLSTFDPVDSTIFCEENSRQQQQSQLLHRRSYSVNDVSLGGGGGYDRPNYCMYYARGFCKNGNSCKFMHGGFGDSPDESGGGNNIDCFDEFLRVKALKQQQQQRFAAASQFMASGGRHPFAYNRCINIFNDNQRSAAAALMRSDEFHKHGRSLPDRNDFSAMGLGGNSNSSEKQIYLTFPADSTFKEEDVSNYFSMYGPVQDVRIPYQQKRMFGFVTFIYAETVRLILAKGNPHFVCDSRVLVKPYKEKGKIPDKKQLQLQQQPIDDRGELSACLSPSGLESRELYNIPFGARMFYNPHEMMLRRKIEQNAELQQAIELQGRRLMNLQLMKNYHHNNHFQPSVSPGVQSASQMQTEFQNNQGFVSSNDINQESLTENNGVQEPTKPSANAADENQAMPHTDNKNSSCNKEQSSNTDDSDPQESLDHILPDNLFTSPTKSAAEQHVAFSTDSAAADVSSAITTPATTTTTNNIAMLPTSAFNMASLKSCYFQVPRFNQEATETQVLQLSMSSEEGLTWLVESYTSSKSPLAV